MYYCNDCQKKHRKNSWIGKRHSPSRTHKRKIFAYERCNECYELLTENEGVKVVVRSRIRQVPDYAHVHEKCLDKYLARNNEFAESVLNWDIEWENPNPVIVEVKV